MLARMRTWRTPHQEAVLLSVPGIGGGGFATALRARSVLVSVLVVVVVVVIAVTAVTAGMWMIPVHHVAVAVGHPFLDLRPHLLLVVMCLGLFLPLLLLLLPLLLPLLLLFLPLLLLSLPLLLLSLPLLLLFLPMLFVLFVPLLLQVGGAGFGQAASHGQLQAEALPPGGCA